MEIGRLVTVDFGLVTAAMAQTGFETTIFP